METTQNSIPGQQPTFAERAHHSKALIAIIAVLGVTVLAMGATLIGNRSEAQLNGAAAPVALTAQAPVMAPVTAPVQAAPAVRAAAPVQPVVDNTPTYVAPKAPARVAQAANVCNSCGTVESVAAVQRQGKVNGVNVGNTTIGLGAVAGGVLGGLLGHQVGGGNGRTAMSVLGAAGGAYAGNSVEKNMNKVTVYDVRVRMDNGTYRHMDISTSPAVGSRVIVEGQNLRMANG
ncbi:MAG: hypothetical protein JWP29_2587 [Rhodoferax sp.]|nr:hypothetical protein [Rhodoferax sp.]